MCSGDLWRRRNDPGYHNFLAVGEAIFFLCNGLRKYAENKMKEVHALITANVGGPGMKCTCKFTPGKKSNPHRNTSTACIWAQELMKWHTSSIINWHQSDSSQWHDQVDGCWEITKLFMSDLGKNWVSVKDFSNVDSAQFLNLLIFCNHFNVQHGSIQAIKEWRNKWAHSPDQKFTDSDKQQAFKDIECLMNDPELVGIQEVQDSRQSIERVETADFAILQDYELRIIQEFARIQEYKSRESHEIHEGSEVPDKDIPETYNRSIRTIHAMSKLASFFLTISYFPISFILSNSGVLLSMMVIFLFSHVGERSVISDYGKVVL